MLNVLVSVSLIGLGGCARGNSRDSNDPAFNPQDFTTTFTRIAPAGYVDMSLEFANPTDRPVVLHGSLVAQDADGAQVPGVTVTTAFGTEAGRAVVMPGGSVDFVQLRGAGSTQVRAITLTGLSVTASTRPVAREFVDLKPLGAKGDEVEYDGLATKARLVNPNPVVARVRIVLMVLVAPQDGVPQEANLVRDVSTVDVPANGDVIVSLDADTRRLLRSRSVDSFVTLRPVLAP